MKLPVFLLVLLGLNPLGRADAVWVNDFRALPQEQSNWCWAASIQSVFLCQKFEVSQTAIVAAAYGQPVNKTAPGFEGTLNLLNRLVVGGDRKTWLIRAKAVNTFPNANWLRDQLRADMPVMIWYKDEESNHSIIIHGGRYYLDANGGVNWLSLAAFDPWHNRTMTIDGSNIPRYVYGTFYISVHQTDASSQQKGSFSSLRTAPGPQQSPSREQQPETTKYGYTREKNEEAPPNGPESKQSSRGTQEPETTPYGYRRQKNGD